MTLLGARAESSNTTDKQGVTCQLAQRHSTVSAARGGDPDCLHTLRSKCELEKVEGMGC